jgi:hypothetical protein
MRINSRTQTEGVGEYGAEEDNGPKREKVTGDWRRLYNEQLHCLYLSSSSSGPFTPCGT